MKNSGGRKAAIKILNLEGNCLEDSICYSENSMNSIKNIKEQDDAYILGRYFKFSYEKILKGYSSTYLRVTFHPEEAMNFETKILIDCESH